jgi:hypothetical protein
VTIAAAPETVYALITDLPTMATLAEEADAMEWHQGGSATPGAVFKGHNSNGGRKWTTTCTVTHAEPGQTFGFDVKSLVIPVAHWRYDIAPAENGCTSPSRRGTAGPAGSARWRGWRPASAIGSRPTRSTSG